MEINKPMGEKVARLLRPGVCDWDPAGLGSNDHFLHPQAIHGLTEKEQAHGYRGLACGIGWEPASVSSGFKTRGSLIHIAAGKLVPGSRLLGQGPRWGGGTLRGRKAGKAPENHRWEGGAGSANPECGGVWVWAPQQQSWRRRFGHTQVLWGEERSKEVIQGGEGICRERMHQQRSESCRPWGLGHCVHHCRRWAPCLPAPIRLQGLPGELVLRHLSLHCM